MELHERITNIILEMSAYDQTKGHAPAMMASQEIIQEIGKFLTGINEEEK